MNRCLLIFTLAGIFPSFFAAEAGESAFRRECRMSGGLAWVVTLAKDDLELCRFGSAAVASETLYRLRMEGERPEAVRAYFSPRAVGSCLNLGGEEWLGVDSEQAQFVLCHFPDGSLIERNTLERGSSVQENAALTQALTK